MRRYLHKHKIYFPKENHSNLLFHSSNMAAVNTPYKGVSEQQLYSIRKQGAKARFVACYNSKSRACVQVS